MLKPRILSRPLVARRALALTLAGLIAVMPTAASATAIDTMLQGMYTAAGQPQFAQTARMNTLSGGYIAVRNNIQTFNIFAVVPPNFSAGCGGIDAYFGTFSFINSHQLEAMIKAIGQNAIPFLFLSAIKSMCGSCYTILSQMQAMAQKMNNTALNSCEIDRGIFTSNNDPVTLSTAADNLFSKLGSVSGTVGDWFSGLFGSGNPSNTSTPGATGQNNLNAAQAASGSTVPAPTVTQVSVIGNNTWKGIVNNNVVSYLSGGTTNGANSAQILMSVIGTTDVELGGGTGTPVASASAAGNSSSSTGPGLTAGQKVQPVLTLKDLVEGNPNKPFLQCAPTPIGGVPYAATGSPLDPDACRMVLSNPATTLSSIGYVGVDTQVNCAMFGSSGVTGQSCPSGSGVGIVAEMQAGNPSSNWTAWEQRIYAQSPIPFVALMARVGQNPGMQAEIASYALPYVKAAVSANLGMALRNAMQQTFQNGGNQTYAFPPNYATTMRNLNSDINLYAQQLNGAAQVSNELSKMVENYLKSIHPYVPGQ